MARRGNADVAVQRAVRENEPLMSVKETAARLGITSAAVYDLCAAGKMAHYRLGLKGGAIKVRPSDADAYLESCRLDVGLRRGKQEPLRHLRPQP